MSIEVESLKKKDIDSYINFINEVFDYEASKDAIEKMIRKAKVLVIKDEQKVVASIVLKERFEYIKNQKYYFVSYLGVKKEYRRKGYASKLFEKVEQLAKENEIKYLELTSGNHRRAAHYFYKDKKFKTKDTTVFIKIYN